MIDIEYLTMLLVRRAFTMYGHEFVLLYEERFRLAANLRAVIRKETGE